MKQPSPDNPAPPSSPPAGSEHMRALIDLEDEAVLIIDVATLRYVDVNAAACRLLRFTREALLARGAGGSGSFTGVPDAALRAHYDELVRMAPSPFEGRTNFSTGDGGAVIVKVWRRAFLLGDRWCVMVRASQADGPLAPLSQRSDIERVRSLMAHTPRAITLVDYQDMTFLHATPAACDVLGHSHEELVALGPGRLLGLSDAEMRRQAGKMVMASPQLFAEDMTMSHASRGPIDLQVTSYAFMADGRWVIFSWLRDITRQRRAERDLQRLSLAIDQAADSVVLIDADTCEYLYANATAHNLLGYTRDEYLALKPWQIDGLQGEPAQLRERYQALVRSSPSVQVAEGALRRRDGTVVPMEHSRCAVALGGRWIVVVTGREITARKNAEAERQRHTQALERSNQELERSNQELERFAYVASHDLSEPLRMVASYTQLLERRYGPKLDDEAREFIGFAVDGARRMKRLIDDLLTYSRAGRGARPPRAVPLEQVADEALKNLEQLVGDTGAHVARGALPVVRGDRMELVQLLQNLVGNALKFVHGRAPRVAIDARRESAGEWTISVEDNGVGIEPQYYGRIFELFQRLHTPDKFQGTGIGLAICKKIVERHGGRIWVQSRPGVGTRFYFTLPAHDAAADVEEDRT